MFLVQGSWIFKILGLVNFVTFARVGWQLGNLMMNNTAFQDDNDDKHNNKNTTPWLLYKHKY